MLSNTTPCCAVYNSLTLMVNESGVTPDLGSQVLMPVSYCYLFVRSMFEQSCTICKGRTLVHTFLCARLGCMHHMAMLAAVVAQGAHQEHTTSSSNCLNLF